jgi:hypothetical protein
VPLRCARALRQRLCLATGTADFHGLEAFLRGPRDLGWYVFDPTGMADPASIVRIGIGRDAVEVAFCTQFGEMDHDKPEVSIVDPPDASPATMEAVRSGDAQVPANSGVCHKAIRAGDRGTGKGCTR